VSCFLLFASYLLFNVVINDNGIIGITFTNALLAIFVIMIAIYGRFHFFFSLDIKWDFFSQLQAVYYLIQS
jgi:hypothetical protein